MASKSRVVLAVLAVVLSNSAYSQNAGSYLAGLADRTEYESWYATLGGIYKIGVEHWVNNRSKPQQASCFGNGVPPESDWMRGCLTAQQRMMPWDAKRKTDAEYRLGWNSIQSPEVQKTARARLGASLDSTPIAPPPSYAAPASGDAYNQCSQEVLLAYQRGLVTSPVIANQIQDSCIGRYQRQSLQNLQSAREAQSRAQAARDAERRLEEQAAAEQSPNNNCKKPDFAAGLLDSFNSLEMFKTSNVKAIDIERLITLRWNTETLQISCRGTFILTNGRNTPGVIEIRPNVAGTMITHWRPD